MNEYTPKQIIHLMKIFYCLGLDEFIIMMGFSGATGGQRDYIERKYQQMKKDIFNWLCDLDDDNISLVFDYASKKAVIYKSEGNVNES